MEGTEEYPPGESCPEINTASVREEPGENREKRRTHHSECINAGRIPREHITDASRRNTSQTHHAGTHHAGNKEKSLS